MTEPQIAAGKFNPGDVVTLKSGGPAMTVVCAKDEGVHCVWYGEETDEVKTDVIPEVVLDKAVPLDDDEVGDDEDEDDEDYGGKRKKRGKK
ncbi:MAG TPA: DUF2158 domain-containing protein [Methylocella sp.]|nr:DUF2158 domain-containing protein [Methylocella sp.]